MPIALTAGAESAYVAPVSKKARGYNNSVAAHIGRLVKLKRPNVPQKQIADGVGLSQGMVSLLLKGGANWTAEYMKRFADWMGLPAGNMIPPQDPSQPLDLPTPAQVMTAQHGKVSGPLAEFLRENEMDLTPRERELLEALDVEPKQGESVNAFYGKFIKILRNRR